VICPEANRNAGLYPVGTWPPASLRHKLDNLPKRSLSVFKAIYSVQSI